MSLESLIPDCPYCGHRLDGIVVNGLHRECNERFCEEFAAWEENMRYSGVVNWRDSEGHCGTIGEFQDIEAADQEQAERIILDEFWDHRLDSADCIPVIIFN